MVSVTFFKLNVASQSPDFVTQHLKNVTETTGPLNNLIVRAA